MQVIKLALAALCLGITGAQAEPFKPDDFVGAYHEPIEVEIWMSERPFRTKNVLEIIPYQDGSFYIHVEVNGYHACSLDGVAEPEGSRLVYRSVPEPDDPSPVCIFSVQVQNQKITFDDQGRNCTRMFCGAHAGFDGVSFKTTLRKRIKDLSRIHKSGGYYEATAEYERLLQNRAAKSTPPKQP